MFNVWSVNRTACYVILNVLICSSRAAHWSWFEDCSRRSRVCFMNDRVRDCFATHSEVSLTGFGGTIAVSVAWRGRVMAEHGGVFCELSSATKQRVLMHHASDLKNLIFFCVFFFVTDFFLFVHCSMLSVCLRQLAFFNAQWTDE